MFGRWAAAGPPSEWDGPGVDVADAILLRLLKQETERIMSLVGHGRHGQRYKTANPTPHRGNYVLILRYAPGWPEEQRKNVIVRLSVFAFALRIFFIF